jgi:hypothetical protein
MNASHVKLLLTLLLLPVCASAAELTGRFSMLGNTASAESGDIGYVDSDHHSLSADQQSLRLMLDGYSTQDEWSLHIKTLRLHSNAYPQQTSAETPFRYQPLAQDWLDDSNATQVTRTGYEIDRALYKRRFGKMTLSLGRQPIDWGSGRFWQPLNVFGAFAPTALDTDFKAGLDAIVLDAYPSDFSSLSAAYVLTPQHDATLDNSSALYYRSQLGEDGELSLLAARVLDSDIFGGAYESAWNGMGWRIEAAHYQPDQGDDFLFWIAGIDYQFNDGTLLAAEWYDNGYGADNESDIATLATNPLTYYALQPQLSRHLLGLSLGRDLTPLLHADYTLLMSSLKDTRGSHHSSLLHQVNLKYSVSNESDLLMSLSLANGRGLNDLGEVQSEFGHLPAALTLRLRFYF